MKHKISISIDEDTLVKVYEAMRKRHFRNKSHAFEHSMNHYLDEVLK